MNSAAESESKKQSDAETWKRAPYEHSSRPRDPLPMQFSYRSGQFAPPPLNNAALHLEPP